MIPLARTVFEKAVIFKVSLSVWKYLYFKAEDVPPEYNAVLETLRRIVLSLVG
jgi:hypothetical protein